MVISELHKLKVKTQAEQAGAQGGLLIVGVTLQITISKVESILDILESTYFYEQRKKVMFSVEKNGEKRWLSISW